MPFVQSGAHCCAIRSPTSPRHGIRIGPTLIFHHGIGADSGIWTDWIPVLADRYRLVRFDMRGFREFEVPAADFGWSMGLLGRDILAVADAVGAQHLPLRRQVDGQTIGLAAAPLDHLDRFLSVTVSNGGHVGGSIEKVQAWKRTIDEQGMSGWSDIFMADRFHPGAIDATRYAWFARQQEKWGRDSILNAMSVLIGADMRAELGRIACPVLLLHGDASPFIPVAVMAELHALLADSRLKVFPRARHGLPFSHGRECAEALRQFLDTTTNLSRSS